VRPVTSIILFQSTLVKRSTGLGKMAYRSEQRVKVGKAALACIFSMLAFVVIGGNDDLSLKIV
jgi:hypothetical protein